MSTRKTLGAIIDPKEFCTLCATPTIATFTKKNLGCKSMGHNSNPSWNKGINDDV
jgi:hypothetical protein